MLPAALMAWSWEAGTLGARPITELIHRTGFWTIRCLLGVTAFCYAVAQLTLYVVQQNFHPVSVVHDLDQSHRLKTRQDSQQTSPRKGHVARLS